MNIFIVNNSIIKKSRRFIKTLFSRDSHDSVQLAPYGDDSCPLDNTKGVKTPTDNESVHVVLGYLNRNVKAEKGEKRFYSQKPNGDESFYIYLKNDGTCEIGGSDDNLIRYSEMKKSFDELREGLNNLVTTFNSHTHPVSGTATLSPTTPATSSTASMVPAKIDNIKTNKT